MNFEDASIFLSVSNPEQLPEWLPSLPPSSVLCLRESLSVIKPKPFVFWSTFQIPAVFFFSDLPYVTMTHPPRDIFQSDDMKIPPVHPVLVL